MGLPLGLETSVYAEYLLTLASPHDVKVTVQVLDNRHAVLSTISAILIDGQVDAKLVTLDTDSNTIDVSRTCSMQFLDPTRTMTFDSAAPSDGALYLDRMMRIIYSVRCPSRWVDVPVFTGPVSGCDRDGDIVNVEGAGKESYGLDQAFHPDEFPGLKVDALKGLLTAMGETSKRWELPTSTSKLVKTVNVGSVDSFWPKAVGVSNSLDRVLMYDGRGVARCFVAPTKSSIVIRGGNGGLLLSDPTIGFDTDDMKNTALVKGAKPKGAKTAIYESAGVPAEHPLNPIKIGLNGKARYKLIFEENTDLRTKAAAKKRAQTLLKKYLLQHIVVTATCLPIPHLEPWDVATIQTPHFNADTVIGSFSLPLRADDAAVPMTIGYQKNLAQPRRIVERT